ncbi:hypothetical protein [Staphylococcus nepalensis]|uniref:hypothetical protein n=1 Tax=Staphylococcus nepalensis TaxID=214473 RepID=UPI001F611534|nr:hypothetical protein [Staphylococcus nepalensis]
MRIKKKYQKLKSKNQKFRNQLQDLEDKLDELIMFEERTEENEKGSLLSKIKEKPNDLVRLAFIKKDYVPPVRRISIFGTLKVKLLKLTLLTVDIPNLHIDLKRSNK